MTVDDAGAVDDETVRTVHIEENTLWAVNVIGDAQNGSGGSVPEIKCHPAGHANSRCLVAMERRIV